MGGAGDRLVWEVDIPLATNPLILGAWAKALAATLVLCLAITVPVFLFADAAQVLPRLAGILILGILGLGILGIVIMAAVFGNRFRARFTLDDRGILYEGIDSRARALARLTVVAGSLGGNPRTAGAGMLAMAGETVGLSWDDVRAVRAHPRRRALVLRNAWRDVLHVYCTADNYDRVRARIEGAVTS
ncbi:MAG: hypothetical protein H6907_16980 [Hyphomicrobiales bacterium]|nr:hypothetical protein [Hyphomicrobiales bacterium]MCP5373424.1 hypothetical protein [Hyphomicrobiales bacterium]